ncbi:MAG: DUF4124 domain-containing protein [Usitatibacter sp.]
MMKMLALLAIAAAIAVAASGDALAQTLYKLIDKNGKVTYTESPPKNFEGKVIRMDIDPNANSATLPKGSALREEGAAAKNAIADDAVRGARQRLENAKKALTDARDNPGEADIQRIGNKGGGTRPQPSEDYQRRLEMLEKNVKDAEEDLQKAQRGR